MPRTPKHYQDRRLVVYFETLGQRADVVRTARAWARREKIPEAQAVSVWMRHVLVKEVNRAS